MNTVEQKDGFKGVLALRSAVNTALGDLVPGSETASNMTFERPPRAEFGDYSTNAALLYATKLGEKPRQLAPRLGERLKELLGEHLERFEVAGPGFLNLFMADSWYIDQLSEIVAAGGRFGAPPEPFGGRVLIEFVSANPTGPLTAAGGRHAAYGDALARILEFCGHTVEREYYINDYGTQVARLGESIRARARGEEVPEDGYAGDYIRELAESISDSAELDTAALARAGVAAMLERIEHTLTRFGVTFDRWFSERALHESGNEEARGGPVAAVLEELENLGQLYSVDGALWLKTSTFGDDKDRVLKRATGEPTYFASDIAYHRDKLTRGFDTLIDIWGADHHGYIARMKAAFEALGEDPERLQVLIMQFVNLVERGERASMSKRRGDFVTLDDLIDQIGVDAARFLMLQRSHDTTVDLDIDLARQQSNENPVYYVQYAHARIASMLAKAGPARVKEAASDTTAGLQLQAAERGLIKKLLDFPDQIEEAAERRAPHRLAVYSLELAQDFTAFYRDCRVVGAEEPGAESFRLSLSLAAQRTIACALALLGVSAPDSM